MEIEIVKEDIKWEPQELTLYERAQLVKVSTKDDYDIACEVANQIKPRLKAGMAAGRNPKN